jgi:hypothetical protein
MTPLETLVMARRASVRVSVDAATRMLVVEADEAPPADVLAGLKEQRELLLEALGDPKWADAWLDMAHGLAVARAHLDAVAARRARRTQDQVVEQPVRPHWRTFDGHDCRTGCARAEHLLCSACGQELPRYWRFWPHLHPDCRLERLD